MCLNGTYPFLSATLVRQLLYYLFRETCFMDSYLPLSCFCFSFAPSGVTVPRGNTAGRGLRGADSRAWSARS